MRMAFVALSEALPEARSFPSLDPEPLMTSLPSHQLVIELVRSTLRLPSPDIGCDQNCRPGWNCLLLPWTDFRRVYPLTQQTVLD